MKTNNIDILVFVEDPGAANYVAPLPAALRKIGYKTMVLASGLASEYLTQRDVSYEVVSSSDAAEQVIKSINPRILLVGTAENPDNLGLSLIDSARFAGITSVGVIDAAMNAEYRFRGHRSIALPYMPDWLLVPDEWTKNAFVTLGFPSERVVISGHPHYDYVREYAAHLAIKGDSKLRRRVLPGSCDNQKIVVFIAEGSFRTAGLHRRNSFRDYTLKGRGINTGRTEIVLEEFLDVIAFVKPSPYVVLRIHPKDVVDDYDAYKSEVDHISSGGSPLELIYAADLIVGMTSMLMTEAVLMGKPTLSIVPRVVEKEWLPGVRAGITSCVTTRDELESKLKALLHEKGETLYFPNKHNIFVPNSIKHIVTFLERLLCDNTSRNGLVF